MNLGCVEPEWNGIGREREFVDVDAVGIEDEGSAEGGRRGRNDG